MSKIASFSIEEERKNIEWEEKNKGYLAVKFYATRAGRYQNKLFSFQILQQVDAFKILIKFLRYSNKIHAVYIEYVNIETGEVINKKDDILLSGAIEFNNLSTKQPF